MIPPSWLVDSSLTRRDPRVTRGVKDESKWNPISVAELSGHLPEARRIFQQAMLMMVNDG